MHRRSNRHARLGHDPGSYGLPLGCRLRLGYRARLWRLGDKARLPGLWHRHRDHHPRDGDASWGGRCRGARERRRRRIGGRTLREHQLRRLLLRHGSAGGHRLRIRDLWLREHEHRTRLRHRRRIVIVRPWRRWLELQRLLELRLLKLWLLLERELLRVDRLLPERRQRRRRGRGPAAAAARCWAASE